MKHFIAISFLAISASAAPLVDPDGIFHRTRPTRIEANGGVVTVASDAWLVDREGWTYATPERIAQEDAAELAVAEEAAAQAALPQVFATGIATMDADGHHIEHVVTGSNQPILGVQVSNSPLTQEQREELKAAAMAERLARKSARKNAESEMFAAKNYGAFAPAFSNAWSALLDEICLGDEE